MDIYGVHVIIFIQTTLRIIAIYMIVKKAAIRHNIKFTRVYVGGESDTLCNHCIYVNSKYDHCRNECYIIYNKVRRVRRTNFIYVVKKID